MIDIELIKEKISQYPLKASDNRILRIFLKSAKLIAVNNIIYILVANGLYICYNRSEMKENFKFDGE